MMSQQPFQFFETDPEVTLSHREASKPGAVTSPEEGMRLVRAFRRLGDPALRQNILLSIEKLAETTAHN